MKTKFNSLDSLVEALPQPVRRQYRKLVKQSKITTQLACMRTAAEITQEHMGAILGMSRQQISQMEAGSDNDITLRILKAYALVSGTPMQITVNPGNNRITKLIKQATKKLSLPPATKDEL
jgi:DNA-binding XRE family transcriptional regulator